MSRRLDTDLSVRASLTRAEAAHLLERLCIELGFCLAPEPSERLMSAPPGSASEFTEAVYREEGLDPVMGDSALYRRTFGLVSAVFAASAKRSDEVEP